jgi:rhodanese-related sulfurtransferase
MVLHKNQTGIFMKIIDTTTLHDWLKDAKKSAQILLIDVRESNEVEQGIINGALHMPLGQISVDQIMQNLTNTHKTQLVFYCRSGGRSLRACEIIDSVLDESEIETITTYNLRGGILDWVENKLPLEVPVTEDV